jgi:hypothetical protein
MSKKEQMFALVEQWRESDMTRKSFAIQHGFKSESFNYYMLLNRLPANLKCRTMNVMR